jgi:hypothetical protein
MHKKFETVCDIENQSRTSEELPDFQDYSVHNHTYWYMENK